MSFISTDKYIKIPSVTTTQRNALTPVNGMIVYDSTLNAFYKYENGAWSSFAGGGSSYARVVVSSNLTAANDTDYTLVANATFTDPTPSEGKGYSVLIRNGTATIGGSTYNTVGQLIWRVYHSGSWATYQLVTQTQLNGKEDTSNKTDSMSGNTTSSTKYLSAKGVYDWVVSLGYITASALSGYATQAWVTSQGYITNVVTALGFTPENVANKSDSFTASSSTTYATTKAVVDGLATKFITIPFISNAFNPLDATNYFFGGITNLLAPSTTNTDQDFTIGFAGNVIGCVIQAHGNTTQGSSEDVTVSLRNNTANTTTAIGTFKTNATSTTTVSTAITGLSIAVGATDSICLQINGTWATNPQGLRLTGYLMVRI